MGIQNTIVMYLQFVETTLTNWHTFFFLRNSLSILLSQNLSKMWGLFLAFACVSIALHILYLCNLILPLSSLHSVLLVTLDLHLSRSCSFLSTHTLSLVTLRPSFSLSHSHDNLRSDRTLSRWLRPPFSLVKEFKTTRSDNSFDSSHSRIQQCSKD